MIIYLNSEVFSDVTIDIVIDGHFRNNFNISQKSQRMDKMRAN